MKLTKFSWIFGAVFVIGAIVIPLVIFLPKAEEPISTDIWENVPLKVPHTDHSDIIQGPFESGAEVTRACLECHQDSAQQVMATAHWTWESRPSILYGRKTTVTVGKKNSINNFCIGIQGNWPGCTSCHAGYKQAGIGSLLNRDWILAQ